MSEWNPRFVKYSKTNGLSPDDMLTADRAKYPGGLMNGYINWINGKWAEWVKLTGAHPTIRSEAERVAFDAWLA